MIEFLDRVLENLVSLEESDEQWDSEVDDVVNQELSYKDQNNDVYHEGGECNEDLVHKTQCECVGDSEYEQEELHLAHKLKRIVLQT